MLITVAIFLYVNPNLMFVALYFLTFVGQFEVFFLQ